MDVPGRPLREGGLAGRLIEAGVPPGLRPRTLNDQPKAAAAVLQRDRWTCALGGTITTRSHPCP